MAEELIHFDLPKNRSSIIKVLGVGGGGGNAVNYMFDKGIRDVDFIVCNTDGQALDNSPIPVKIQLGASLTEGRGAGNKPEVGKQAAIENLNDITDALGTNTKMVFITSGMGGGTGTGAAPVIAKAARELEILTVAIVTIPFRFEGRKRINQAIEGIAELEKYVDSLLVINNEKLREVYGNLKFSEAFSKADDVLSSAAKGIAEIITVPGYINVDFADVQTVMQSSGVAIMGSGTASGEGRALSAIQDAINSPLLNNNDINGAENILLNITSGSDEISMDEINEITDYLQGEVSSDVNVIWGIGTDESLGDNINVTIIATGFESNSVPELYSRKAKKEKVPLTESEEKAIQEEVYQTSAKKKNEKKEKEDGFKVHQRTIEFDIYGQDQSLALKEDDMDPEGFKVDERKAGERMKKIKDSREELKQTNFKLTSKSENIEKLESEPAYKRKKLKLENFKYSEDAPVSKFSLSEDENNQTRLKDNNSFLHDNVD